MSTTLHETQPPVPALEIQMLRLYYKSLDENRKQQLLNYSQQLVDYAQQLIEEQHAEKGTQATAWA